MSQIELRLAVDDDADNEVLADKAIVLHEELAVLDVEDITPFTAGGAPVNAKGVELAAVGVLVVKLARSSKLLAQVVDAVRDWLQRNTVASVRLEIDGDILEITNASAQERKALVDSWIQRHSDP